MKNIVSPVSGLESFLRSAQEHEYSMQCPLVTQLIGRAISEELRREGLLVDQIEMQPTNGFAERGMRITTMLHAALNDAISVVEGFEDNHLPLFSVRVFEPGRHSTTIHRNHPSVGPWALGLTLQGTAPFNVYDQSQLPRGIVLPLKGDGSDPEPYDSMIAGPGACWALYTKHDQLPHSGGLVTDQRRELILFYGTQYPPR